MSLAKWKKEPALMAILLIVFSVLFLFILFPLFNVFKTSVFQNGSFDISIYRDVIASKRNFTPFFNSLKLGAAVAVVGTLVGYIFAYVLTMTSVPFKKFFRMVATFPIISPPFVIALAAILLFGQNGWVTQTIWVPIFGEEDVPTIYGFWGLLAVETLSYFPTAFLVMVGIFSSIDPVLEEAAWNQGASRRRVFKDVIFPLSLPGVYSSLLLIFIESLADFGNPLILSGDYKVLSVEAYLRITGEYNLPEGSALAMVLLVPSLIAFFIQKYYVDKKSFVTMSGKPSSSRRNESSWKTKAGLLTICFSLTGFVLLFYGTVVYGSFVKTWGADNSLTLANYTLAIQDSWDYIIDTIILAAIATPLTGLFGMIIAYLVVRKKFKGRGFVEVVSMLTFAVPGTIVGIGYVLSFNQQPLLLTGTAYIIVILFIFRNAPVGIRSGVAALKQVDPAIEEASTNLGAGTFTTFTKVVLPLIAPAFFSGLAYAFVRCMTAISAVIFVVSGQWNLITIAILGFVENSYLSTASAMCILLVVFVSIILGLMQMATMRMGGRHESNS